MNPKTEIMFNLNICSHISICQVVFSQSEEQEGTNAASVCVTSSFISTLCLLNVIYWILSLLPCRPSARHSKHDASVSVSGSAGSVGLSASCVVILIACSSFSLCAFPLISPFSATKPAALPARRKDLKYLIPIPVKPWGGLHQPAARCCSAGRQRGRRKAIKVVS